MAPHIYIISPDTSANLAARLHAAGLPYAIADATAIDAELILLDATAGGVEHMLPLVPPWAYTAGTPLLILANTPAVAIPNLLVGGWLTAPISDLEIVGAVRSLLAAHQAATPEIMSLRERLATAEVARDALLFADQKKDEFISYISHELKNPMASIKGYADLMYRRSSKLAEDPNRKGLSIISNQVGRMTVLLDQLLDYSRISLDRLQLDLHPVNLVPLAQRLVDETQALTDRHAIQLVIEIQPMPVQADENRLRQAMLAIASNAIKFSPLAGTIVVRVTQSGDTAQIAVDDKGIGVPLADQPFIFDRFVRGSNIDAKHDGLGLGLFLAREIVTRHGGTIAVKSEVGNGSVFTIGLPIQVA